MPSIIVYLYSENAAGLVLGVRLRPGEGAGHGGAEEHVDQQHHQEQDTEHHAQPQQPGGTQLTATGHSCKQSYSSRAQKG